VTVLPSYIVYDPSARERFHITGSRTPEEFRTALDAVRKNSSAILKAAELLDEKKEVEAGMLLGNTYGRIGMMDEARSAYKAAKTSAEAQGQKSSAQMADALSAFTFARDGNPKRAIKLLEKLTTDPADHDTEALIWMTIGNVYRLSSDNAAALQAYQRASAVATPGSAAHKEILAAIAELHP
jgi:tetratricopeptide (TPR) repeat protein